MFEQLRVQMVKNQIEARGISDKRVLDAMRKVERHMFAPGHNISAAYEDHPLPIGHGQTISQPYIVALMTELCGFTGNEKVLEIGTGSGYQTAILSLTAGEVYTVELIEALGKNAEKRLSEMGYKNVHIRIGDGYKGWPEKAPFNVIMLTASPDVIPETLISQLDDGGIIVAPEGNLNQELVTLTKTGGIITKKSILFVRFVPMIKAAE